MKQCTIAMILAIVCVATGRTQDPCAALNYHPFKAKTFAGAYEDLGDLGTELFPNDLDDGNAGPVDIGFPFEYNCDVFTQFTFNTNGYIKLGTETTPSSNVFFSNATSTDGGVFQNADSNNVNLIVVFNHDIEEGVDEPDFRVHTSGVAPLRVCTIQWENMREWTSEPEKQYDNMDFQIRLYETSNVIEFVYGQWDPSGAESNFKTGAVGLKGSGPEDDQLLVVSKGSRDTWDKVVFHSGDYQANECFFFGNPAERPKPDVGRTYRFTPTYHRDLTVLEGYALYDVSTHISAPQVISAVIRNSGYASENNIPVILDVSGANTFRDTQYIAHLDFGDVQRVTFDTYTPEKDGISEIRMIVPDDDDDVTDNAKFVVQVSSDHTLRIASDNGPDGAHGYISGAQGNCYVKYPIAQPALVDHVSAYISNDSASIGKSVFGVVLDHHGNKIGQTDDIILTSDHLNAWLIFPFSPPPMVTDPNFYAGVGLRSQVIPTAPLGVQTEDPLRPDTYYNSFINSTGLMEMDSSLFHSRFMISASVSALPPVAGIARWDTIICYDDPARLLLESFQGNLIWQVSDDGIDGWTDVPGSAQQDFFFTSPLTHSVFFRAAVSQPGHDTVYSNIISVLVIPEKPSIHFDESSQLLTSSAPNGNQWHNQNGPISGATDSTYMVTTSGQYFVTVLLGNCGPVSSDTVDVILSSAHGLMATSSWNVSPNPATDQLFIQPHSTGEVTYSMMDLTGKIVASGRLWPNMALDIRHLMPGVYYLKLRDGRNVGMIPIIRVE